MRVANAFIRKLFKRANKANTQGREPDQRLLLNEAQCPEFFALRDRSQAVEFRAEIQVAADKGAIRIQSLPRAAPPMDVQAIEVADIRKLAEYLGEPLGADRLQHARAELAPFMEQLPVLGNVLSTWGEGKKVRGCDPTPDAVSALVDATKVVLARRDATEDMMLRRFSRSMFKNSKRIEAIEPWVDLAYGGDLAPSGLHSEDVRSALGLHHEPQAFFLYGKVEYWTRSVPVHVQPPYVGLPTRDIKGFQFTEQPVALLLVENKQSFHEFAAKSEHLPCAVVYTAGMPSPSWRQAMGLLLAALDPLVPVYHMGDIDLGGFRIAANIAKLVRAAGRELRPWLMDPSELAVIGYELEMTDENRNIPAMQRWCREAGWEAIADELARTPGSVEQELIEARFPI